MLVAIIAPATILQSERGALIALCNSTDGDSWTYYTGWLGPARHSFTPSAVADAKVEGPGTQESDTVVLGLNQGL